MNGVHDLGGMHGFGPVLPEADEPIFHERWEARVLACNLAAGRIGGWNIDRSRHTRESLPPAVYLNASYYEIWLRGLEEPPQPRRSTPNPKCETHGARVNNAGICPSCRADQIAQVNA